MPAARRPLPDPAAQPGIRLWLVVAVLAVLAGLAAAIWLLWPREDKVAAVTALQQQLLAAGGPPRRADVDRVIRTVDRMSRDELRAASKAAGAEWKRVKQEAIAAYFEAAAAARPSLLDDHIARMVAYHDLLVAMNPGARPGAPAYLPRDRRRRGEPEPPQPAGDEAAEAARRQLVERFDAAVEAHAKARGRQLPAFR
jgi:hypothetical protein